MNRKIFLFFVIFGIVFFANNYAQAAYHFSQYKGRNPIHVLSVGVKPAGLSPDTIKSIYNLPKTGGHGTIALIGAYYDKTIEKDLGIFSSAFGLPSCTTANGCFEKHATASGIKTNSGWSLETSLDVEWAHAIAPNAKILLVEAATPSGANLLKAIDYANSRADVVAISMSFGGGEFPEEKSLDSHFVNKNGASFFASSGDNGTGASWPASSPNVVSVGGTTLSLKSDGTLSKETAWSGSGGGVSVYEAQPSYQSSYSIPKANGMRAIPDVSYDADPYSGFSVYAKGKWYVLGGTSAGAPQWAGIQSLGLSANNENFYADKASANNSSYLRDITSGTNGDCGYICQARKHYDYVTGLGSPLTVKF